MEILYFLIPLSLLLLGGIVWIFLWAVKNRQFEDLEGPAYRILMDDEAEEPPEVQDKGNRPSSSRPNQR